MTVCTSLDLAEVINNADFGAFELRVVQSWSLPIEKASGPYNIATRYRDGM
jgi:hypothetical protein